MSTFVKGGGVGVNFGRNEYARSTIPNGKPRTESYTFASASMPTVTPPGETKPQKILQPGTVLAKITSGADAGKVGVFQAGATDGRQTLANIVGVNDTFLPWQLLERDVEVSAAYDNLVAVQAWCIEYQADGTPVALSNTTANSMVGNKSLDIKFV